MFKSDEVAVRLTNISKNYMVYTKPHHWLMDFLGLKRFLKEGEHYRSFWALRDINLEIPVGGKYALIGRNGAGKSTLLRIISDNIAPTEGKVEVNGRVEALLELGTGFNVEFTGRENIFNSLAYMGIIGKKAEEKFWDIVDFSELDEFIDQPVKTYSSGMYVRLAFSVATVIAPQILIIDEILSAGDMYFQSKCLARIQELISGPGTTVIFVSHDLYAAQRLCDTFVWIDRGRIVDIGPSMEIRSAYEASIRKQEDIKMRARNMRLKRKTLSALQATSEEGIHLMGQFVLDNDKPTQTMGPHIHRLHLYTRSHLSEQICVGDAMDDNSQHYPSFLISNPAESSWTSALQQNGRMARSVQAGQNGVKGAKFALFMAFDDFSAEDFQAEVEVNYQDTSTVPCHLEVDAGLAGLTRLLSLEHKADQQWKTARVVVPKWIYAPDRKEPVEKPPVQDDQEPQSATIDHFPKTRVGTRQVVIDRIQFFDHEGSESFIFKQGSPMSVVISYHAEDTTVIGKEATWAGSFVRQDGVTATHIISQLQKYPFVIKPRGKVQANFTPLLLGAGTYRFSAGLFAEYNLFGYNQHFTTSSVLYDMHVRSHEIVVEDDYRIDDSVFRHPVTWNNLDE